MFGTEIDLLGVCKAYHARGADLCATIAAFDLVPNDSPSAAELQRQVEALLGQWQALRCIIIATPASDVHGLRAKLAVLCALHEQSGDCSCSTADLARSLLADACKLASRIEVRYGADNASKISRYAAPVNDACNDQQG